MIPLPSGCASRQVALARALSEDHTVLIDAEWFVEFSKHGGIFLSRQQMEDQHPEYLVKNLRPDDIFQLEFDASWGSMNLIDMSSGGTWLLAAISYPWLEKELHASGTAPGKPCPSIPGDRLTH